MHKVDPNLPSINTSYPVNKVRPLQLRDLSGESGSGGVRTGTESVGGGKEGSAVEEGILDGAAMRRRNGMKRSGEERRRSQCLLDPREVLL